MKIRMNVDGELEGVPFEAGDVIEVTKANSWLARYGEVVVEDKPKKKTAKKTAKKKG